VRLPARIMVDGRERFAALEALRPGDRFLVKAGLGHILKSVEAALSSRSAIERTVDRISRIFVPGVVLVAVVTFLVVWMFSGEGLGLALMRGITVLVIACPWALGIATPLAVTAAVGAASGAGILVRDSRVLETIQKVDLAAFP